MRLPRPGAAIRRKQRSDLRRKQWSDLPPDLLRQIAGRLHVAADFVSFHAVCKPWRNSRDLLSRTTTPTSQFLPWLLAPTEGHGHLSSSLIKLRCVFSKSTYRVLPPPYPPRRNWVCSAHGGTVRYLTVDKRLRPSLHDPITGAVTGLPSFPYMHSEEETPCGIVYGDGTILLYGISHLADGGTARFRAALLRPGDEYWTILDRTFETTGKKLGEFCAAYHGGSILVTAEASMWHIFGPDGGAEVLVPRPWMPGEHDSFSERYSYVLESHGELLWAWVKVRWRFSYDQYGIRRRHLGTISVSVHALEQASVPEKVQWVRKEGHCLANF
jgi:hypothetical protein